MEGFRLLQGFGILCLIICIWAAFVVYQTQVREIDDLFQKKDFCESRAFDEYRNGYCWAKTNGHFVKCELRKVNGELLLEKGCDE